MIGSEITGVLSRSLHKGGAMQGKSDGASYPRVWAGRVIVFGREVYEGFTTVASDARAAERNIRHQYALQHNGSYPPQGQHTVEVWEKKSALATR